jgi:glutathione peroxidase
MSTLHDFRATTLEGEAQDLRAFEGKVVLIVNVASQCGFTPHYAGLEKLYETYGERGFTVLGFPCNQFGAQEPGTAEEIRSFCTSNYGVTFPLFAKIDVNGDSAHDLYRWLTNEATQPDGPGPVKWNFAKFLVGKDGRVIGRYSFKTDPQAPELVSKIEGAL